MEGCLRRRNDVSDVRRSVGKLPACVAVFTMGRKKALEVLSWSYWTLQAGARLDSSVGDVRPEESHAKRSHALVGHIDLNVHMHWCVAKDGHDVTRAGRKEKGIFDITATSEIVLDPRSSRSLRNRIERRSHPIQWLALPNRERQANLS